MIKIKSSIQLKSGSICEIIKVEGQYIPDYFLVSFPVTQGEPNANEVSEMISIGICQARKISFKLLEDKEAFSVLYSGYSARRAKGWHIHIIILGNRWKKAWLYFVLTSKNILQALNLRRDDAPRGYKN